MHSQIVAPWRNAQIKDFSVFNPVSSRAINKESKKEAVVWKLILPLLKEAEHAELSGVSMWMRAHIREHYMVRMTDVQFSPWMSHRIMEDGDRWQWVASLRVEGRALYDLLFTSRNRVSSISAWLPVCKTLILSRCGLSEDDVTVLGAQLLSLRLETLDLSHNQLGKVGMQQLSKYLKQISSLKVLNVENTAAQDEGIRLLAQVFEALPHLSRLLVGDNALGNIGGIYVMRAIHKLPSLRVISLRHNNIDVEGTQEMSFYLNSCKTLEHIDLRGNVIEATGFEYVCKNISDLHDLQTIDVSHCWIGDAGLIMLSKHFGSLGKLSHILLDGNGLTDESFVYLFPQLRHTPHICYLSLRSNSLCAEGASALAEGLQHCKSSLTYLDLGGNALASPYDELLCSSLQFPQLSDLRIDHMRLGGEAARALANAFKALKKLKNLDISFNNIDDSGIIAIGANLQLLQQLECLQARHNRIGNEGGEFLIAGIITHPSLKKIDVSRNVITASGARNMIARVPEMRLESLVL